MDTPRLKGDVAVAGVGVVSAAGDGAGAMLAAAKENRVELRENAAYSEGSYLTSCVGAVPSGVWDLLRAQQPGSSESHTFLLANRALAEARHQSGPQLLAADPRRVGLVLSTTKAEAGALGRIVAGGHCDDRPRRHILASALAADLASAHGARGPVQCVSVACISGLLAIQQGARLILSGLADAVLVIGVDVLSHFVLAGFSALKSLDPRGCRPFDKDRQGLSLGEGAGALVLLRSDMASAPLAHVTGWGVSNDANHLTGPSRDGSGLALAIGRALGLANVAPGSIDYVNAHGTGTAYNDRMEALALQTVFGDQSPWVSSCKGLIGHTLGAAGVIESALCIVAAREHWVPGTPGFLTPDPDAPARVADTPRHSVSCRRVLKMNSGFGGTNSAVVLEVTPRDT